MRRQHPRRLQQQILTRAPAAPVSRASWPSKKPVFWEELQEFHRGRSVFGSHSLGFFRTEGVDSAKVLRAQEDDGDGGFLIPSVYWQNTDLIGWSGQLGCTGVWAAELGLISMAL